MGIRMLHRRPAPAQRSVPVHAVAASTARVPFDLAALLRTARVRAAGSRIPVRLGRGRRRGAGGQEEASGPRLWAELVLGYLALALTLLPRSRPLPTMTVFTAAADVVSERAGEGSLPGRRTPGPGATA